MSGKTRKYTQGEIGEIKVIEDFLPPPRELVLREDNVKVTLSLRAVSERAESRGIPESAKV
jgi:hypothetical protein